MRRVSLPNTLLYLLLLGLLLTPLRLYAVQGSAVVDEPPPCPMVSMQAVDGFELSAGEHCGSVADCFGCVSCVNCLHAPAMTLFSGVSTSLGHPGAAWTIESAGHMALRYLTPDTPPPRRFL